MIFQKIRDFIKTNTHLLLSSITCNSKTLPFYKDSPKFVVYKLLNLLRAQNEPRCKSFLLIFIFALFSTNCNIEAAHHEEVVFKLKEGNRLIDEGDLRSADSLLHSLHFYSYEPLKKYHNILRARSLLLSSPEECVALLRETKEGDKPWNYGARYCEAWCRILEDKKEEAMELLQDEANPSELQLLKAKLWMALDEPEKGLSLMEEISGPGDEIHDETEILLVKALLLKNSKDPNEGGVDHAINLLIQTDFEGLKGYFRDYLYLILGKLYFEKGEFHLAQQQWNLLLEKFPLSPYRPDALYWIARAYENTHQQSLESAAAEREILIKYPDFAYADEIYFNQYPLKDYLEGDKEAVIHLERFPTLYPSSPLTIVSYYLIGLDHEQERRAKGGKTIRKKNLKEAIHSFEMSQKKYEQLKPDDSYYRNVKNLALLERGRLYYIIAAESGGPKKEVYQKYAEEQFSELLSEEREVSSQAAAQLARLYLEQEELEKAKVQLSKELEKWGEDAAPIVSTLYTIQGEIAFQQRDFETAWQYYFKAEETGGEKFLSPDQQLDLWIRQALCYQELEQYDQAMLLFSKAINKNVVSSQRLRAMYLRAEIYRKQGREELAKKQWEAVALKGGEWGQKAKKKLEE